MRRTQSTRIGATKLFSRSFASFVLLVGGSLTGCNNTCVSFTSNQAGSSNPGASAGVTVNGAATSCPMTAAKATLRLHVGTVTATRSTGAPTGSTDVHHVYVTLASIEARGSGAGGADSTSWIELASELNEHPQQVDLLAPANDACSPATFEATDGPAGVYQEIRIRTLPNHPGAGDAVPQTNLCGNAGWNCVVFADGTTQPLEIANSANDANNPAAGNDVSLALRIPSERSAGGSLVLLPGATQNLVIAFDARSSLTWRDANSVHLVPAITVSTRAFCSASVAATAPR